jgi:predicted transcriptional regulator
MAKKTETKEHLSVKISPELYVKIKNKAEKSKRSAHYMMVECLEKGFK